MSLLGDISSVGYDVARTAGKVGSITNDAKNLSEGRFDKVVKKQLKKASFKDLNKALNAGFKMLGM